MASYEPTNQRINGADSGQILIDGVDVSKIGLRDRTYWCVGRAQKLSPISHPVRTAISIIPQEPQLFEGTIRQNVDVPGTTLANYRNIIISMFVPAVGLDTDGEIWNALDQVRAEFSPIQRPELTINLSTTGSSKAIHQQHRWIGCRSTGRRDIPFLLPAVNILLSSEP